MSTFDYTVELERSLLKIVSSSSMQARRYMHRVRESLFTSEERKFIFNVLKKSLDVTGQLATRKVFEYEVGKRVEDSDQQYFVGEWNLVDAVDTQDAPEVLLDKLEEANTGRDIVKLGAEVDALLEGGRIAESLAHLKRRSLSIGGKTDDRPLVELTDYQNREQTLLDKIKNPDKYRGIQTGFTAFDNFGGGLFPGELTLIAGLTGTGKSTLVRQIVANVVTHPLNFGANVLYVANEEYLEQVEHKFDANFSEVPYLDFKRGNISDEDIDKWRNCMQKWERNGKPNGRVFIKEVPAFTDVTLVEQAYRQCEARGIKIGLIIIDHLPHIKPIQQVWGENDEMKKAASDCKDLARSLRVHVVIPTQAATEVMKKQERGRRGSKLDVYGSKGQVHVANTFILITETGKDDAQQCANEWDKDVLWLVDIKKNRDGPPFYFRAKHKVKIGRIEEILGTGQKGDPLEDKEDDPHPTVNLIKKDEAIADSEQSDAVNSAIADGDDVTEPDGGGNKTSDPVEFDVGIRMGVIRRMRERKANASRNSSV